MKLSTPFVKLPVHFDVERLSQEISAFASDAWAPHPNRIPGNSALRLITLGGGENDDVAGAMAPTPHLLTSPYIRQVLSGFGVVWSRSRLMQLAGGSTVPPHADINYHWFHRVRLHIPIVTTPDVRFHCDGESVHMAPGEAWVFDNWRTHRVENPNAADRIHLVADTSGTGAFWRMVAAGQEGAVGQLMPFRPDLDAKVATERHNQTRVMPPSEIDQLLQDLADETVSIKGGDEGAADVARFRTLVDGVCQDWRQMWALYGDTDEGLPMYGRLLDFLKRQVDVVGGGLTAGTNGVPVAQVVAARVLYFAINEALPSMTAASVSATPAAPRKTASVAPATPSFDRPLIIVAAPRSGSTALFEALAATPQLKTVGGEAHWLVEEIEALRPGAPGVDSNRLDASHFNPSLGQALTRRLGLALQDANGGGSSDASSVRLLEKTPKNALRIPFFNALFPDARFVFLWRDPAENISSIMEAWRAGGWVTYRDMPGWEGPWSLLLPPGWQGLKGRPLAEIAAHQWAETNRIVMDDLNDLPPERRHVVRYSEFVADPAGTVRDICDFADIAFDEALSERTANPLPQSRYTLTAPKADKWRANASDIEPLLPNLHDLVERLGRFR